MTGWASDPLPTDASLRFGAIVSGFGLGMLAAAIVGSCGCSSSTRETQLRAADAVARVYAATDRQLERARHAEQARCVSEATSRGEAESCVAGVRRRWASTIDALDVLAVVHDRYATALETGATGDAAAVIDAWCAVVRAAPAPVTGGPSCR